MANTELEPITRVWGRSWGSAGQSPLEAGSFLSNNSQPYARFPSFHRCSSTAVSPLCVVKFRCSVSKEIPFHYSRKRQKAAVAVLHLKWDRVLFFPLFRSVASQPTIDADELRHTAAAVVYGNGKTATEEQQRNGGNQALHCYHMIWVTWHRKSRDYF